MNNARRLILAACVLAFGSCIQNARAFTQFDIFTFTAGIIFVPDIVPPDIFMMPLSRVSPLTNVAVANGSISDNSEVTGIQMFYSTDRTGLSTATYSTAGLSSASPLVFKRNRIARVFRSTDQYHYEFQFVIPPEALAGATYLDYRIQAVDSYGNVRNWPASGGSIRVLLAYGTQASVGNAGGTITLPDGNPLDGETALDLFAGSLDGQRTITVAEVAPGGPAPSNPYGPAFPVIAISPIGMMLSRPGQLSILYQDMELDGTVDGTRFRAEDLKLMWWDGFEWRLAGGRANAGRAVVTAPVRQLGWFTIFPLGALSDDDYRPRERIITPALADGINDFAFFGGLSGSDVVNIYDVNGRRVRQLKDNDFIWDGRDTAGDIVESGVYVYQIKTEGRSIISGTIAVAK